MFEDLGNLRAFRALSDLVKARQPSILFLSETKCGAEISCKLKKVGNFSGYFSVNSIGSKGGLSLLWLDKVDLRVIFYSQNHRDSEIGWKGSKWSFTCLYGHPECSKKDLTWQLIKHLNSINNSPWLLGGDFNEILKMEEKLGGIDERQGYYGEI